MRILASPVTAGAIACTAAYAWLAVADAVRFARTPSAQGSLVALLCAAALMLACLKWATRGATVAVACAAAAGLLNAAAAVTFTYAYGRTGVFLLLATLIGSLSAGVALAGAPGHPSGVPGQEMIAVPALFAFLALWVVVRSSQLPIVVIAPLAAVAGSIILRLLYSSSPRRFRVWISVNYLAGASISACLLAAGMFGLWLADQQTKAYITAAFLLTIIGAVLGGVFLPYFKADYEKLMQIEGDPVLREADRRPSSQQHKAALEAWPRLGGYALSATASMLVLTVALAPSLGWQSGHAAVRWLLPLSVSLLAVVAVIPAGRAIAEAGIRHPSVGQPHTPHCGRTAAVWCAIAGGIAAALGTIWLLRTETMHLLAVFQAVLLTLFAMQNLLGNGAWLHARRIKPEARLAITVNTLAVYVIVYWSITDAVRPAGAAATVGASFGAFVCATVLAATLVITTVCATYVADGQPYHTDYPPLWGAIQDTFLMTCMWFLLAWMPQVVLTHVPAGAHERWSAIGTILAGFLLLFGPAFLWILENNDTHVERQRIARDVPTEGVPGGLTSATSSVDRIGTLPQRIGALRRSLTSSPAGPEPELTQREFVMRLSLDPPRD